MALLGEVLVAVPVMLAVLGSVLGLYQVSVREQDQGESRARTLAQQREGLRRMTRELRQARKVVTATEVASVPGTYWLLRFDTYVKPGGGGPALDRQVQYACLLGQLNACYRWESADGGTSWLAPTILVTNVANSDVFDVEPNATLDPDTGLLVFDKVNYVKVKLDVNVINSLQGGSNPTNPIELSDGIRLRNVPPPVAANSCASGCTTPGP